MKLTVRASGPAAPDLVWDRYLRPTRWPEWAPQIRSVDYPDEVISAGGTGVVHGPCGISVHFEIDDVDGEGRQWSWRAKLAGITLALGHTVGPDGSGTSQGTLTTLDISGPAPVVVGYAPIARIALERLVR